MEKLEYDQKVEQVRLSEEQAKEMVKLADSLERLMKNKDFVKIISEGYFKVEASRLVLLRADQAIQNDEKIVKSIDNKIVAVGELRQYFNTIFGRGNQAKQALIDHEEYLRELEDELSNS